jgi:hypothetical protein
MIHTKTILVGLNVSEDISKDDPFCNFHSSSPTSQDYSLRETLHNTPLWGSYITDLIKDHIEKDGSSVVSYMKRNPHELQRHIDKFKEELKVIGANKPSIIAIGSGVYDLLKRGLGDEYDIHQIYHYSSTKSKKEKKDQVIEIINKISNTP